MITDRTPPLITTACLFPPTWLLLSSQLSVVQWKSLTLSPTTHAVPDTHPLDEAVPGIPHLHHANPQSSLCPLAFPYMSPRGKPRFYRLESCDGPQSRERGTQDWLPDNPVQPDSHPGLRWRPESPIPASANDSAARWLRGQMTRPWIEVRQCGS